MKSNRNRAEIEKFIKESLISEGYEQNEFGTILATTSDGASINLTLVIADIVTDWTEQEYH